ncbi:MAG: hypothetical protein DRN61_00350 [Thaumarchaeota archaeon]|nr:MAG: hypothetical protein DRN61_00350 [Nitrososphaerota archaeon]
MSSRRSYAVAPAPLSSIFSPKLPLSGKKVEEVGARGGGFTLRGGVETYAEYSPGEVDESIVYVNGSKLDFITSLKAIEISRRLLGLRGRITLKHEVSVPIGMGFGASASIAFTALLALFKIAGRGISVGRACSIVHGIEVECKTGLNSEAGFLSEGLVLVLGEGAPPRVRVDSIPIPRDSMITSIAVAPLDGSKIFSDPSRLRKVEEIGDEKLEEILEKPTPENFLEKSREFALEAGLATKRVQEIFEELEKLQLVGYAQNMIGEACHALVLRKDARKVEERLKSLFPEYLVKTFEVGSLIRSSIQA